MAENKQESAPEPEEKVLPAPVFTEASADKPTSAVSPDALAKQVAELLRPDIEKAVQSSKDRRFDRIEKSLAELAELEARGATIPDSVKQEARLMDFVESRLSSAPVARSDAQEAKFDPTALLKEIELDGNSPDVLKEWMRPHRNEDHLRAELLKIKNRQLSPAPDASSAPAMQEGKPITQDDVAAEARALASGGTGNAFFDTKTVKAQGGGVFKAQ